MDVKKTACFRARMTAYAQKVLSAPAQILRLDGFICQIDLCFSELRSKPGIAEQKSKFFGR